LFTLDLSGSSADSNRSIRVAPCDSAAKIFLSDFSESMLCRYLLS